MFETETTMRTFTTPQPPATIGAQGRTRVLVEFEYRKAGAPSTHPQCVRVPLERLDGGRATETWMTNGEVTIGATGGVLHAHDGNVAVAHLHVDLTAHSDLVAASEHAYTQLLCVLHGLGYRHTLRFWNFLEDITAGVGDQQRYQQFCTGRGRAFVAADLEPRMFPAASAVGTEAAGLYVHVLAAKEPGTALENPRQTQAYRYPRVYGSTSPAFARATAKHWPDRRDLYVAGTASILGHASMHRRDPVAQCTQVLANLKALLSDAAAVHQADPGGQAPLTPRTLRVYLRRACDLPLITEKVEAAFAGVPEIAFVRADICRDELLVEIEGLWSSRPLRETGSRT